MVGIASEDSETLDDMTPAPGDVRTKVGDAGIWFAVASELLSPNVGVNTSDESAREAKDESSDV